MFLRFQPFSGPRRFTFVDPDTGFQFEESSKDLLINRINAYRSQNNLEVIERLPFVLENYWCGLAENAGACVSAPPLERGFLGYVKGGIALVKQMAYGKYASQNEADRRASICIECPLNAVPTEPGLLSWTNDIAEASVGNRKSIHHDSLGSCAGCSCPLRAKVFYTGKIELTKDQENVMRAANPRCWQLKENKNG